MCGWTRDLSETSWIWDHGIGRVEDATSLPSSITHPPIDESSPVKGMFMYTDFTSYDYSAVIKMKIVSEYVPKTAGSCLTFYYMPLAFSKANNQFQILLKDANSKYIQQSVMLKVIIIDVGGFE